MNGIWSAELAHVNYLELLSVFLALKHFLPHLRGQHVLLKSDRNRQGDMRSSLLHKLAWKIILWSGSAEQRRGSHVKRKSCVWGMEAPSPSGEPAVAEMARLP